MAQRRAPRVGMERRRHGDHGLVLRRVPHPRTRRHAHRLARLARSPTARSAASPCRSPISPRCTCRRCSSIRSAWRSGCPTSPTPNYVSDSIAWFARIAELARRTVSSGRILPAITQEGPFTVGPLGVRAERSRRHGGRRHARPRSPIRCRRSAPLDSGADVAQIFDRLVDGIARGLLAQSGWRPELGKQRRPELQALRATFGALSKPDQVIRGNTDEFDVAVDHLQAELERHRRRAGGEPVVIPRLRLIVPDDPLEPWIVRLELVDDRDASRWCTANDVWERSGERPRRGPRGPLRRPAGRRHRRHRHPDGVHPRPGRSGARTRTDGDRFGARRRRGLHRHRPGRAASGSASTSSGRNAS